MSEYLRKKAVLEWLDDRRYKSPWIESFRDRLESGAFDADENEIQRLRETLEMAQSELRWGDPTNAIERVERIIDEALSTTTEPTNAEKVERVREGDGNDA